MAPTATDSGLGDGGANGATGDRTTLQDSVNLVTSKLNGLGNVAVTAAKAAAGGVTSVVSQPTLNSKGVMQKESEYGAHK